MGGTRINETAARSLPPSRVTVVRSPACHLCEDAEAALAELADDYPLVVEWVDATGDRGRALVTEHRAPMFPLVLVDDQFFSFGRLPRKKLRKLLDARIAAVA